jgi:hypothetical protein
MKPFLLRFVACLFFSSSTSQAAIIASDQDVFFSGSVEYLDDPYGALSDYDLALGDSFTAGYNIDTNLQPNGQFVSVYSPQLTIYPMGANAAISMTIDFAASSYTHDNILNPIGPTGSYSTYIGIGNDVSIQTETSILTGDFWGIFAHHNGAYMFQIGFWDTSGTIINNEDFFINTSPDGWDSARVNYIYVDVPNNLYMEGVAAIPVPTTAWLFGSALAGLLVANRKRS